MKHISRNIFLTLVLVASMLHTTGLMGYTVTIASADVTTDGVNETLDQINETLNQIIVYLDGIWNSVNESAVMIDDMNTSIVTRLDAITMGNTTTLIEKLNIILERIGGSNSSKWDANTLYGMQNYILCGLIDENNFYILHNGTLADTKGYSVLRVLIDNQQAIADVVVNTSSNAIAATNLTRADIGNKIDSAKTNIIENNPTALVIAGFVVTLFVFILLLWRFFFRKSPSSSELNEKPDCFGDKDVYDPKKCKECFHQKECRDKIFSTPVQPVCFGQFLSSDEECRNCDMAMECKEETEARLKEKPISKPRPAPSRATPNPLEGF